MSIDFSAIHLVIGNKLPSKDDLGTLFAECTEGIFNDNDTHYIISKGCSNGLYWIYCKYGKAFPYSPEVINSSTDFIEENPRTKEQAELNGQLFACYIESKNTLYISNMQKLSFLDSYFKSILAKEISLKKILISADEFLEKIKSVKSIKFAVRDNLFSNVDGSLSISPEHKDIYGLGVPDYYEIKSTFYNRRTITEAFKDFFKKMAGWQKTGEAQELICVGIDDKGVENTYNSNEFVRKIKTLSNSDKDEYGFYNKEAVFEALKKSLDI